MFTSNERGIRKQAQVDFTRSGWRQFIRLNRSLGARFLRGFVLRYELAASISERKRLRYWTFRGADEAQYAQNVRQQVSHQSQEDQRAI